MDDEWDGRASWIFHPTYDDTRNPGSIVLFRRQFHLSRELSSLTIAVTADTRYRLFLNGHSISVGPCKGTPSHWYYETVDATSLIRRGSNVLAAQVLRYSPSHRGNTSVTRTRKPGFVLLAQGEHFTLSTDLEWRCIEDASVSLCGDSAYDWFLAINENVNGSKRQFGWTEAEFDDSAWLTPREFTNEFPGIEFSELSWSLFPRTIPQLPEIPRQFKGVLAIRQPAQGSSSILTFNQWNALLVKRQPLVIPGFQEVEVDIEAAEYSTGYLYFAFQNGKGALVSHLSAESFERSPRSSAGDKMDKGDRRDFIGGYLNGQLDQYTVAGRDVETYEPFWFRTFRFIRFHIQTNEEPLTVKNISYRETNYPLEVCAEFDSSTSPMLSRFWEVSLRTLKNCMHETYEDCPYYEQTQFAFDTRIQMLLNHIVSTDDRLIRNSIHDFHASVRPDGLIPMRCPSHTNIVLPAFSLFFPFMIHDHLMYVGDLSHTKRYFPTVEVILNFYHRHIGPSGLVSKFSKRWWSFVDWVDDWKNGAPDAAQFGPATYFSLVYALSLGVAADLAKAIGRPDMSTEYTRRKSNLIDAVNTHCFDGTWYYDGPSSDRSCPALSEVSQHCQIYAILSGAIDGTAAQELLRQTLEEKMLRQVTLSQKFYLFQALEKTGLSEFVPTMWQPWKGMLDQGLDTWAETLENPRSDCHAWSAAPLYVISSTILGIRPAAPGFKVAQVSPAMKLLDTAAGSVPTPYGPIKVYWSPTSPVSGGQGQSRSVTVRVEAPKEITVKLSVQGACQWHPLAFQGIYEGDIELV